VAINVYNMGFQYFQVIELLFQNNYNCNICNCDFSITKQKCLQMLVDVFEFKVIEFEIVISVAFRVIQLLCFN